MYKYINRTSVHYFESDTELDRHLNIMKHRGIYDYAVITVFVIPSETRRCKSKPAKDTSISGGPNN